VFFEYASLHCGVEGVVPENIPSAENNVVERGERNEFVDLRASVVSPFSEPDRSHLGKRAYRLCQSALYCLDSRDECRTHSTQANQQNAELTLSRSNVHAFSYHRFDHEM